MCAIQIEMDLIIATHFVTIMARIMTSDILTRVHSYDTSDGKQELAWFQAKMRYEMVKLRATIQQWVLVNKEAGDPPGSGGGGWWWVVVGGGGGMCEISAKAN